MDEGQRLLWDGGSKPEESNLSWISRTAAIRCRNKLQGDLSSLSISFFEHLATSA